MDEENAGNARQESVQNSNEGRDTGGAGTSESTEGGGKGTPAGGIKPLIGAVMVAAVMAAGGLGGYLAAGTGGKAEDKDAASAGLPEIEETVDGKGAGDESEAMEYYAFDPVLVNLAEDRLTRYIRATVTLKIALEDFDEKAMAKKKPALVNWLVVNLSDRSLEEVTGAKNLNRLRRQILDAFNDELSGAGKPIVREVLFQEFAVQ